ncbi:hypothetical protein AB0D86_28715 [Streptomyces sp. NPDC048324]|uniref:hypothetical protein n=1 Tax=Streptomyces sp. NPDC048324 TaxID=3157205 RepID=UPI00344673F4
MVVDTFSEDKTRWNPLRAGEAWMRLRAEGGRPAVVFAERADDAGHSLARGIDRIVRLS